MPRTTHPGTVRAVAPVVGGIIGGVFSYLVLVTGSGFSQTVDRAHIFLVWMSLLCAQGVLAGAGGVASFAVLVEWWRRCAPRERVAATAVAVLVLGISALEVVAAPILFPLDDVTWPLEHQFAHTLVLGAGISAASFVALTALWLVALAPRRAASGAKSCADTLRDLGHRRDAARWLLWFLGAQVSVLTLATGALNRAMVTSGFATEATLPAQLVLAYGAYFAVMVACAYLPVHVRLLRMTTELRDALLADLDDPIELLERRKQLADWLDLDRGFAGTFKDFVPIAAPLVAGIASFALPK